MQSEMSTSVRNYLNNFHQSMTDKLIAQMNTKVNVVRIADESVDKLKTGRLHIHINYKHNYYAQLYLPCLV